MKWILEDQVAEIHNSFFYIYVRGSFIRTLSLKIAKI